MVTISSETRRLSGKAVGARGSGKTLYAAWQTYEDFMRGVGSIVIDPLGSLSAYILSRIVHGGDPSLWARVIYVPVGGMEVRGDMYVVPTPFLYQRTKRDTLQDQVARVIGMWARLNPQLENAPVQGMAAIKRTANYAGMLLAAMGNQLVPDAAYLIDAMGQKTLTDSPWLTKIQDVAEKHPDELAMPAAYFLQRYPAMRENDRLGQVATFLSQIDPYVLNPRLAAQYGANVWGVDLSLAERGHLILFDFQYLTDEERRAGTTWIFTRCMELFRARGPRRDVVGFVLDELSRMVDRENRLLETDFKELIQLGRNYGISCFFTYQEVTQPPPGLVQAMDMVGYSLYSGTADPDAALRLARLLDPYDPTWVKEQHTRIVQQPVNRWEDPVWHEEIINVYYSAQEQELLNAEKYRRRPGLTFAVAKAAGEGSAARYAGVTNIRGIRDTQHFETLYVEEAKRRLVKKRGRRVADVLAEIRARQPTPNVRSEDLLADEEREETMRESTPQQPARPRWDTITP
jgi:hypothetical protein